MILAFGVSDVVVFFRSSERVPAKTPCSPLLRERVIGLVLGVPSSGIADPSLDSAFGWFPFLVPSEFDGLVTGDPFFWLKGLVCLPCLFPFCLPLLRLIFGDLDLFVRGARAARCLASLGSLRLSGWSMVVEKSSLSPIILFGFKFDSGDG